MGDLLRLDRRCEIEAQAADSATVVTEARSGVSSGWLAAIGPHSKQSERLKRWSRVQVRASEMEIEAGAGTKTYFELADGLYEAESVYLDAVEHKAVLRVVGGSIEVLDHQGLRDDDVLALVLGLTTRELKDARAARLGELAGAELAAGLVPLVGTEKQVAWVLEFRLAKVQDAAEYLETRERELAEADPDDSKYFPLKVAVEWLRVGLEEMRADGDAGRWIARVGVKGRETLRATARGLRDAGRYMTGVHNGRRDAW